MFVSTCCFVWIALVLHNGSHTRIAVFCSRYLTGLEALALQGVPSSFHTTTNIMTDAEYMSLAGNAFNAGSYALMLLSALATIQLSLQA